MRIGSKAYSLPSPRTSLLAFRVSSQSLIKCRRFACTRRHDAHSRASHLNLSHSIIQCTPQLLDPVSVTMVRGQMTSHLLDALVVLRWVFDRSSNLWATLPWSASSRPNGP